MNECNGGWLGLVLLALGISTHGDLEGLSCKA